MLGRYNGLWINQFGLRRASVGKMKPEYLDVNIFHIIFVIQVYVIKTE